MTTEDRRKLVEKLEAKQLLLDAQDGRNVDLAEEIRQIHEELYPDEGPDCEIDDEDTCCGCGVTFVEMCDFDDYHSIKETGRCRACEQREVMRIAAEELDIMKIRQGLIEQCKKYLDEALGPDHWRLEMDLTVSVPPPVNHIHIDLIIQEDS